MTFTIKSFFGELEDGNRQTRRLPRLGLKYEVSLILGKVAPIDSGRPSKHATSRRSEDPSRYVTVRAGAGSRQMKLQLAVTLRQAVEATTAAILK